MGNGIDISSHQPAEDWAALAAAGIMFAAVKRTGGGTVSGYTNPYGRAQIAGARGAGLVAEHYLYLGEPGYLPASGADQAARFIAEVGDDIQAGELPIVDWEEEGDSDINNLLACLVALEARYGVIPGVYTYPDFAARHIPAGDTRLARYPLFYASYRATEPAPPFPWAAVAIWQYSDNEDIPGVGHVDGDRFDGTAEQLRALGRRIGGNVVADQKAAIGAALGADNATGEDIRGYVDDQGRAHLDICFGGVAVGVAGVNTVDAGISVTNAAGETWDRSVQANVFQAWVKRG